MDALVKRAERDLEPGGKKPLKVRDTEDGRLVAKASAIATGQLG